MIEILTKQHRHGISIRRNVTAVMGLGVTPSIISKPALMPKLGGRGWWETLEILGVSYPLVN